MDPRVPGGLEGYVDKLVVVDVYLCGAAGIDLRWEGAEGYSDVFVVVVVLVGVGREGDGFLSLTGGKGYVVGAE